MICVDIWEGNIWEYLRYIMLLNEAWVMFGNKIISFENFSYNLITQSYHEFVGCGGLKKLWCFLNLYGLGRSCD